MFEVYFDSYGEMYDQNGNKISFIDFINILKKNGVKIEQITEKRRYSICKQGDLHYTQEEGNCEVLRFHI